MITSRDFAVQGRIMKPQFFERSNENLDNILGIDSEAYDNGEPFMICVSDGRLILPEDFFEVITTRYLGTNFMVYNLKYDSGAFLYFLPRPLLQELRVTNETKYKGLKITYIPKKILRFKVGKESVSFWDISQFYKMSLDAASKKYLGESKIEMATKRFTRKYVRRFYKSIMRYCIKDAELTMKLGRLIIKKLNCFDITVPSLYSCASISYLYFDTHTTFRRVNFYLKHYPKLIQMACDAYAGGKFEVSQRGTFEGYEYDITSAYPYEIQNLVDLQGTRVVYNNRIEPDAIYSFYRVEVIHDDPEFTLPFGPLRGGSRVYPTGHFFATITKNELFYIRENGVKFKVHGAAHIFQGVLRKHKRYPFRRGIRDLFQIKSEHKNRDAMLYGNSKTIMNSFYGKLCQCTELPNGKVRLGQAFQPIYASVITANTRLSVTRIQNELKRDCAAVHTDSVMTKKPIPAKYIKDKLGFYEFVEKGTITIVACGMYQIGEDTSGWKGFQPGSGVRLRDLLEANADRDSILMEQQIVQTWIQAAHRNLPQDMINRFQTFQKEINLNCDRKRLWGSTATGRSLLEACEWAPPVVEVNTKPRNWD